MKDYQTVFKTAIAQVGENPTFLDLLDSLWKSNEVNLKKVSLGPRASHLFFVTKDAVVFNTLKDIATQKKIQGDFHYRTNVVEDRLSWVDA